MNLATKRAISTVWDYMQLHMIPKSADAMIVLGCHDDRVARYAAKLAKQLSFQTIVVTGSGLSKTNLLTIPSWPETTEAEHFAAILRSESLKQPILIENKANNAGQNAIFSQKTLLDQGYRPSSLLLITRPFMERRAIQTFKKQWAGLLPHISVSSAGGSFESYIAKTQTPELVINIMVGDLQRIIEYPQKGLMAPSKVPLSVLNSYKYLKKRGYTKHLL